MPLLQAYVREHPEALVSHVLGGPGHRGIGEALRLTAKQVRQAWKVLGLPPLGEQQRTEEERRKARREIRHESYVRHKEATAAQREHWRRENPERAKAIDRAARRRWERKVLRQGRCVVCGATFPWTNRRESKLRRGVRPETCSAGCTRQARLLV